MFCNNCAVANELYACSESLIVGMGNPDTDYHVFFQNDSTDLLARFEATSDNAGLITVVFPEPTMFAVGLHYSLWVTTTTSTDKVEITSGDETFSCIYLKFKNVFDDEGCCICLESQTIKVKVMEEDECICLLKQLKFIVGVAGTEDTDHNFILAANQNEQSIQLGNSAIIPANAQIIGITIRTLTSTSGAIALSDVGTTSGGDEILMAVDMSTQGNTQSVGSNPSATSTATSIYFSITPSTNWSAAQMLTGKWEIRVNYIAQLS